MSALMFSQMGLSAVQAIGGYAQAQSQASLQRAIQSYRNTMLKLSAARSKNALTVNEARIKDQAAEQDILIQRQSIVDIGRAEVDAAAAGVGGNSVKNVARELRASAGRASFSAQRQKEQQLSNIREQKTTVAIQAITGQDIQVIPKPSAASALLGLGTNLLGIYDSHQPVGSRLLGYNGENAKGEINGVKQ